MSITTPLFWDCNCKHNYIHPKEQTVCQICGADADEQPDSMISEVVDRLTQLVEEVRKCREK